MSRRTIKLSNEIDGCFYSSRSLVLYHERLKAYVTQNIISDFKLPEISDASNNKYNAKKVIIDGITFDSINESKFYLACLYLKMQDIITDFKLQQEYELQPAYRNHAGQKIRKISYIADFVLFYPDGTERVIDIKGMETPVFKLKKKLFEYKYPTMTVECIHSVTLDMLPPIS